jgi:F-type H+-transporting ATPase subunit a
VRQRRLPKVVLIGLGLAVGGPAAWAAEGGAGGERAGSWLNWLYQVKVHGQPLVRDQAEIALAWSLLLVIVLCGAAIIWGRRVSLRPGAFQALLETGLGALQSVMEGALGPRGAGFLPFLGSIFLYVLLMNLMGVIPGFISPTTNLSITAALAVTIFVVVQCYGVKEHGIRYVKHFLEGLPPGLVFLLLLAPLIFVVHVVGELIRPISLSLRLFGNIFGEETVVAALVGLVASTRYFFWVPVQLPNLALGLLTSVVQALIMSLLAAVYLAGVLQHQEGETAH